MRTLWDSSGSSPRAVEPPDQLADQRNGQPLAVVERDQLVHQPLGMHPAKRVGAYSELAGVVGDDDRVVEQAVAADAAPERAFGGDLDGVRRHLEAGDPERLQVRLPGRSIGEVPDRACPPACKLGGSRRAGRSPDRHGFSLDRPLYPLSRAISSRSAAFSSRSLTTSPSNPATSRLSSSGEAAATSTSSGSNMHPLNHNQNGMPTLKIQSLPGVLPRLPDERGSSA
jgi:hypothetical protein